MDKSLSKRRFLHKLAESRFLTTSLIIHVVLVLLLGGVVLFKASEKTETFSAGQDGFITEPTEVLGESQDPAPTQEFEESDQQPAAANETDAAQSALAALSEAPATWSTSASFDQVSFGSNLSAARSMQGSAGGSGQSARPKMGGFGRGSSFSFMGIQSSSRRVIFLLDASGSMVLEDKGGGKAYAKVKDKLVALVDELNPETEFNVVMFGHGAADVFKPEAVPATDNVVSELRNWLAPYMRDRAGLLNQTWSKSELKSAVSGSTRLDIALTAAFEMRAETIFILTDGTPNVYCSPDPAVGREWQERWAKNKAVFEKYEADLKKAREEWKQKYAAEIEAAGKKCQELNAAVEGRTQESYSWRTFLPEDCKRAWQELPQPPEGYNPPSGHSATAAEFNTLMKEMSQKYYAGTRLPQPELNVIGYHVDDAAEAFLKEMTRGISGKYRSFRKE